MKRNIRFIMIECLIIALFNVLSFETVSAETLTGYSSQYAARAGKYIYYIAPSKPIMRYDTKKGKTKKIYSCKAYDPYIKKKNYTNGFSNIAVKGNYIYVSWTKGYGTSGGEITRVYIYKISKDGKKAKKLGMGASPVIVGERIYYDELKKTYEYGEYYYESTGNKMSMDLNGKNKKREYVDIKKEENNLGNYKI